MNGATDFKPYKIVIAYDGTDYHGWQEQVGSISVASVLQDTFKKVFGHDIKVVGSSRTDAGVHALGQVARFYTNRTMHPERMRKSWNAVLPSALHIRSLEPIVDTFHPQHNVAYKVYYYHFCVKRPLPHYARYAYFYPYKFDCAKLRTALACFEGTHDFFAFTARAELQKSTICTIEYIRLEYLREQRMYRIVIRGNRFLHTMIRRIVGTALKVATDATLSPHDIMQALQQRTHSFGIITAPARGLVLRKIVYRPAA